jgi:glutathione S-transferase
MKLYDFPLSPSPRKVRLFIAEKGLELPTVTVNLRERAQQNPEYLDKNPSGTVPMLELDDGTRLTESLAICSYLEHLHPEPNLMGHSARERALVLMWNDIATLEGYLALQEVLRNEQEAFKDRALPGPVPYAQIPALAERGRKRAALFFDRLERHLGASRYVTGERFTYADIVLYVYTGFAERALGKSPAFDRAHLARWAAEIAARPAILAAA